MSASVAFDEWRSAVEAIGVTVIQFPIGEKSCRGFSLWDDRSPLIAVNTAWRDEARVFTLFHELGHLVTRTNSACATAPIASSAGDPAERWCESFASAVLIPADALSGVGRVTELGVLSNLARTLRVSLRAMALRLITLERASWSLYESIPRASDAKRSGGGGSGRNRAEIRADEIGQRTRDLFVAAVRGDVISESQALDYLDTPSHAFEEMFATAR
jgi:Zn-dependent peptidase ImmA (M78 family)